MSRFVPRHWQPKEKDIEWAKDTYRIDDAEVKRQIEEYRDHEFRRSYTDWDRAFRNWFRSADKYGLLKREHVHRTADTLPEYDRQEDIDKFHEDMKRFKVVK